MKNNELNVVDYFYIGKVMKSDPITRKVYCYIPRLMMGLSESNIYSKKMTSKKNNIRNKDELNISDTISKTNIFAVPAIDMDEPMPKPGSLVYVWFIDSFENCYWEKYNRNGDYQVIDEERYPKIINLSINDKSIDVNDSDNIQIEVPEDFKIIVSEDKETKTKKFKLEYNPENGYTLDQMRECIDTLSDNIGYFTDLQRTTVISSLNTLLRNNTLTEVPNLSSHITDDIEYVGTLNNIVKMREVLTKDKYLITTYNTINDIYETYSEWLVDNPTASMKYLPTSAEAEDLYESYKADADKYDLAEANLAELSDKLGVYKTINYFYDGTFLGSHEFFLFTSTASLPDDINNKLVVSSTDAAEEGIKYYRVFEHLYEDPDYTTRLEETAQRNINAYVGQVEVISSYDEDEDLYHIAVIAPQELNNTDTKLVGISGYQSGLTDDGKGKVFKVDANEGTSIQVNVKLKNGFTTNFNINL